MRLGSLCPLGDVLGMQQRLAQGFEFIELQIDQTVSEIPPHLPNVPLIWQSPANLPAEHSDPIIQQAVLESWRQQLRMASQVQAVLMVVQFWRPLELLDKTSLIEQYVRLLTPLTVEAREMGVQLLIRNSPDNRDQLQLLREIVRQIAGLGVALDIAYAHHNVVKNLASEYLWDSDLGRRLGHVYVSDTNGRDPRLRLPLGSVGADAPDWSRLVSLLRERYNGSITIDIGNAAPEYRDLSRQKWLDWWG
jgi:sugar phosphate isomerase/epimerase